MESFSLVHQTLPARVGESPHPGLLLLHGRGTDEQDLLPLAAQLDGRLFTISARGPFAFPWGGHAWYDMAPQGVGYPAPDTLYRSLELLETFIGEILNAYPVDPTRLYAAGFSQGAAMAASLIMTLPHRIAGGIVLSGYLPLHADLPFQPEAAAGHPVFQAHGTYDPVIPVHWAHETRDYLASTPVDLTYNEYPMAHSTSLPEMQDVNAWLSHVLSDTQPSV